MGAESVHVVSRSAECTGETTRPMDFRDARRRYQDTHWSAFRVRQFHQTSEMTSNKLLENRRECAGNFRMLLYRALYDQSKPVFANFQTMCGALARPTRLLRWSSGEQAMSTR